MFYVSRFGLGVHDVKGCNVCMIRYGVEKGVRLEWVCVQCRYGGVLCDGVGVVRGCACVGIMPV